MPRKKRASVVDTLLSVKGVARLLRNFTVQDRLGPDNLVASCSSSLAEQSSTGRHSQSTSETSGIKRRHQRAGTRSKSDHPDAWPESLEPRDPKDTFQDDESEADLESDSRYALFQASCNDFSEPSSRSQSIPRTPTTIQLPTQRGTRSVISSSKAAAKTESPRIDGSYRRKTMREDTNLESSGSERSITRQKKSYGKPKDDNRFNRQSASVFAPKTAITKNEPRRDYAKVSDGDQCQTKKVYNGRSYQRQFTKQAPGRQVRFVKSNAHLRGLVDKLSTPTYDKFEAHYQKMLAQKQDKGLDKPKSPHSPAPTPNPDFDAPPLSSQSAAPELLTALSLPASSISMKTRALPSASVPRSRTATASEVSAPIASPSAFRTNASSTAATVSSDWDSTAVLPTAFRTPSRATSRAPSCAASRTPPITVSSIPSHTASRAASRTDLRSPSCATSRTSKTRQHGCDSFIITSAAASMKPTLNSRKSTSNRVDPIMSPRPESTEIASMYRNPVNEEHSHAQSNEKVDEHGDKQHGVQVNEEPGEQGNGQADEHVDEQLGQHIDDQANNQGNKQPDSQAKNSVSTSKETAHGEHATIPDVAINGNNETGSNTCPLNGLHPEVYDCKHDTRHCFACSRPRDVRYVDFRHRYCRGEEPQRSLCRTCHRRLDRDMELDLKPGNSSKRTLTDIKKFHWCAQCGTIRSHKFHEHYPSGTEVPPRHQLCHPCCKWAKLPHKSELAIYAPAKVDNDAGNNSKKRESGDEKDHAGNSLHRHKDIRPADDRPRDGPAVIEPMPSNIQAQEMQYLKASAPVVSSDPGHQHHPSKSRAMTESLVSRPVAESSSQGQTLRPVAYPSPGKHDPSSGLDVYYSQSWQIPVDDSPPPQRKRSTATYGYDQGNEGQLHENLHVNYHEILGQEDICNHQAKHHRGTHEISLPEILLTVPTEEVHITQPTVVLNEQCPESPLHDHFSQFSWKDGGARHHSKYQCQPSMQSRASNQTVHPSDNNFTSCRNKENYPSYPPQHTTPRQFHWPTGRGEVDNNQPKGLSDMFYETAEGKRADAFFASMSNWSEPNSKLKPRNGPTDNYNTWPPGSYNKTEPAAYEYLEKRRSKRASVIPGSPPHSHVRNVSDSLSVETVGVWQGVTPGAPKAEVTEPESPAGEEVLILYHLFITPSPTACTSLPG
ncbi:hypothetical protein NEUTE2DRAFT_48994 [Neurospora tetrasperma FGSC 2509]|nr:hypothetical protein NEUTE2DRAFT_48994 [Neurospora tetrasperma FGSC 2509]